MGKSKSRKKVQKLNQIIVQQQELIKSKSSMDALSGTQVSPSAFWGNANNEFGFNDPTINTTWLPPYEFTYQELNNLYKNPLVRRVIKLNMDDSTREGFELTSENDADKAVDIKKEMDERFNWLALGRKMIGIRHNFGGGVLFADIDDGREPDEPLNENNIKRVWAFRTIDRFFAHPITSRPRFRDEKPGQPMHYKITIHDFKGGESFTVHESRLIRYPSYESDDILTGPERQKRITWDMPTAQVIYDAVKRYGIGMQTGSSLLQGFIVDIFKVANLKDMKNLDGFREYVTTQWQLRNSLNAQVMGSEDELERMQTPVAGMEEITKDQRRDVGMVTEIPVPVLFSEESGDLGGSTLDSSLKVWYSKVTSNQKNRDEPMYRAMLNYVALEQKWDIEDIGFKFNSLEYLSAKEQVEVENMDSETAKNYVEMGLPEKNIFDAKLTGPEIKVGAINYDPDAFEEELKDREAMEGEREEMESLLLENQVKNTDPEVVQKESKKEEQGSSTDEEQETFVLEFT